MHATLWVAFKILSSNYVLQFAPVLTWIQCCAATLHATIIRLFGDQAGNSGGSPVGADANDVD
jgi:uncharacterized membrane protein